MRLARLLFLAFLSVGATSLAAEIEDKDLAILKLQKIIAEQTMSRLLENVAVAEYERIRSNYQRLLGQIAEKENAGKENRENKNDSN